MEQGVAGPNPARFNKKKFFVSALKVGDYLMKSYNNCYFSSTSYSLLFVVLCLTPSKYVEQVSKLVDR